MTPDQYITKAIRAIETDQPNLAMLYMRRGYKEMERLRPDPWKTVREAVEQLYQGVNNLIAAFGPVAEAMTRFAQEVQSTYDQEFYALVSDD